MIRALRGILIEQNAFDLVLDVHGVGYAVSVSANTARLLTAVGTEVALFVFHLTRDDGQRLFGFYTKEERTTFESMIKISGFGPKLALMLLSNMNTEQLKQAIATNDLQALTGLPGIGKKTASRLMIELKDSVTGDKQSKGQVMAHVDPYPAQLTALQREAASALVSLGYKPSEASQSVLTAGQQKETETLDLQQLIKDALRHSCAFIQ